MELDKKFHSEMIDVYQAAKAIGYKRNLFHPTRLKTRRPCGSETTYSIRCPSGRVSSVVGT
jgi:hypothetical protein